MNDDRKPAGKGLRGEFASAVLLAATLGFALAAIFITLDALKARYSALLFALLALALLGALTGGALHRVWSEAVRSMLNGVMITAGYMSVYFIDALLEDHAARHTLTIVRMIASVLVLVLALRGLERLPPAPGTTKGLL